MEWNNRGSMSIYKQQGMWHERRNKENVAEYGVESQGCHGVDVSGKSARRTTGYTEYSHNSQKALLTVQLHRTYTRSGEKPAEISRWNN